jgi:pilus assembly protein CpaD
MRSLIAVRPASGSTSAAARLLSLALLGLLLAGCKTLDEPGNHLAGWTIVDPTERHPIMVSQQPSVTAVRISRSAQGLAPAQRAQVADFLEHYRASDAGNSKLVIAVPAGSPNEAAAVRAVAEVRQIITAYGFADSNIVVEPYHEPRDPNAPIRLSYLRFVAEGPECGRWTINLADDPRNLPYPNLGCAQQKNLAAQVANPADLLGPRTMDPADQERRLVVFDKYRQGKPTQTERSTEERVQVRTLN